MQFKYERLPGFCFKCSLLDHVTGRCRFGNSATLTSELEVTSKLYGHWLKAEVASSLNFVNKPAGQEDRQSFPRNRKIFESNPVVQNYRLLLERSDAEGQFDHDKSRPTEEIRTTCEMNNKFETLNLTLNRQFSGDMNEVSAALLHQVRTSNNDPQVLA